MREGGNETKLLNPLPRVSDKMNLNTKRNYLKSKRIPFFFFYLYKEKNPCPILASKSTISKVE